VLFRSIILVEDGDAVLMVCVCAAMTELLVHWADPRRRLA